MTVIVTTWGDESWAERAARVAIPSASGQATLLHHHAVDPRSAGAARNQAVEIGNPRGWICFLDADDRLGDGYIDAMTRVERDVMSLPTPALGFFDESGVVSEPKVLSDRDILKMNPCPIGTLIHRDVFDTVARFWHEPAWEDWSLFRRAHLIGCPIVYVDDAHYWAAQDPNGRNSTVKNPRQLHRSIIQSHTLAIRQ